jgi:hypothetical protein
LYLLRPEWQVEKKQELLALSTIHLSDV